ncbi:MAG: hypothetical protein DRJ05_11920 [Bacteroidetes bacterium]|nr:MAG: hypothetical protein DRJ05_11920 [Bacteroidota bacterium]
MDLSNFNTTSWSFT